MEWTGEDLVTWVQVSAGEEPGTRVVLDGSHSDTEGAPNATPRIVAAMAAAAFAVMACWASGFT